ncbi:Blp family class II bacteriocin [Anoxybacillus flavithermus]|uniref:Blp family class II bacteriocin n=1 Tax=Anoxybacillus flavithermus TaxID=33934 RepID=UPI0009B5A85D|nr:Blp family class II bacteriocin [Anoxybacillus flavithermus]
MSTNLKELSMSELELIEGGVSFSKVVSTVAYYGFVGGIGTIGGLVGGAIGARVGAAAGTIVGGYVGDLIWSATH